jgi:phosphoglycolate phosphatase
MAGWAPPPALLFDLDGTLTDPFVGITRSIHYALDKLGRPLPPVDDLCWFIGPPLKAAFHTLLDTDDEQAANEGVRLYRERYSTIGKFENRLIDGIPQALARLVDDGYFLSVATSKPRAYAADIIDHFDLRRHFSVVHGAEFDGRNSGKADLIAHILASERIDPARTVMIGDRSHDIEGAAANGVPAVGVLWGYGERAELEEAGAAALAARPEELPDIVRKLVRSDS